MEIFYLNKIKKESNKTFLEELEKGKTKSKWKN